MKRKSKCIIPCFIHTCFCSSNERVCCWVRDEASQQSVRMGNDLLQSSYVMFSFRNCTTLVTPDLFWTGRFLLLQQDQNWLSYRKKTARAKHKADAFYLSALIDETIISLPTSKEALQHTSDFIDQITRVVDAHEIGEKGCENNMRTLIENLMHYGLSNIPLLIS